MEGLFGNVPPACVAAEFLGTLFFQFFGGACSSNSVANGLPVAALGNGLCLAVIVYSTAGISGGHLNPAVSAGFVATGRLGMRRFILYVSAQLLGACLGAAMLRVSLPPGFLETPFTTDGSLTAAHPVQTFLLEFIATFILVYTVFATAVDRTGAAKNAAPLTIGLAVAVGVFAVGPFTGGAINPARTIGAAIAFWDLGNSGIYVAATLAGGICAGKLYDMLYLWDVQPAQVEERDE